MIKMLQYKMYPAGELRCPTTALVLFCLDGNSCVVAGIELCHAKKGTFNMVIAYFLRCFLARLYEVQGELL